MGKRIRGIVIAILFWALAVVLGFSLYLWISRESKEYTIDNSYADTGELVYISDNYADNGIIWKTDLKGKLLTMFTSKESKLLAGYNVRKIDIVGDNIYALFSKKVNDGRESTRYCVALMNENLMINFLTPEFALPMELNLSGFNATEDKLYITALSDNGQQAYAFVVAANSMVAITDDLSDSREKWEKSEAKVTSLDDIESVWPRFFTDAEYTDGRFELRYDNSEPGYFAVNDAVAGIYEKLTASPGYFIRQRGVSTSVIVLVFLGGCLIITALSLALADRRRVVYAIASFEIILLVLVCGIVYFLSDFGRKKSEEEFVRFAVADSKSIVDGYALVNMSEATLYNSDVYGVIADRLKRRTQAEETGVNIVDELLVNVLDGEVVISASGHNRETLGDVYGGRVENMLSQLGNGDDYRFLRIGHKGRSMAVLATSLHSAGQEMYAIVTVTDENSLYTGLFSDFAGCLRLIAIIFVIGSLIGLIIMLLQSADLRRFQKALSSLAKGEEEVEKEAVVGRDMNFMWNSLTEIRKNIITTNRIKFLTYEAYFRFAPKSIERILRKQSITEIKSGDMISSNGALALLYAPGRKEGTRMEISAKSDLLGITEECRENYDGILISQDNDIRHLRYLFTDDNKNCISFGTELMLKLKEDRGRGYSNSTMILHYAPYTYGISGDDRQAAVYFASEEAEKLWNLSDWFRQLRLALVVTEELLHREGGNGDYRYIGFVAGGADDPGRKIRLYEALDALPAQIRSRRVRQKPKFAEALELFYQKDYYISRGVFSEILRESPDDELAKWYLFECERYLNDDMSTDFGGELHMD